MLIFHFYAIWETMFKYLTYVPVALALFLWLWLIRPLPVLWLWRVLAGPVLLFGASKLQLIPLNSDYQTGLPMFVLVVYNWLYALVFVGGIVGLAYLLAELVFWSWQPRLRIPFVRFAVVGGLAVLMATFGIWQALKVPDVRPSVVAVPNLPQDLKGLRVALITDLHVGPLYDANWTAELVRRVNAAKPDIIAVTGDIVDGPVSRMLPRLAPLADLRAPLGVYYVTGNHEYYSGFTSWMRAVRSLGLRILENSHVELSRGQTSFFVAGVADPAGRRYEKLPSTDISKALSGVPKKSFTLLLAHQPLYAATNAAAGVDVQLSGHTHGGTVLPLQSLIAGYNSGFVSGLYAVDSMRLFVSNGAGVWSGIPLRLGVVSEVPLLILQ